MRTLVTLSLILFSLCLFGQELPNLNRAIVKMWAVDSENNRDSVEFGYDKNATVGIDSQLGEKDILGQAFNSTLELRSFQRKPENQICGQGGYTFYSSVNFDSKINFRNRLQAGNFFEFFIKGIHYPIQLYADFKELFDSTYYSGWTQVYLVDSLCGIQKIKSPYHSENLLFTIENNKQYLVKVKLDHTFDGISEINNTSEFNVFPTLVTDYLTIENTTKNQNNFIEIYNSLAQKVLRQTYTVNIKLDLKSLRQGIYFVQLKSGIKAKIETIKITKK
jgi:uncharacterized protein YnzC (UPF0291/DUF896 family)